jgi:serine/threonine-protein kinase ATR
MLNSDDEETRRTYILALAIITATSVEDRSIGRLAASSLVDESSMFYSAMPEGTDIWV